MAEPRTRYTFVVRDAQAPVVRNALAVLRSGNNLVAELVGPLVDDGGVQYWNFSGSFTNDELQSLKDAIKSTRILKDVSWWENEGSDTGKLRRERGLRAKEEG